MKVGKSSTKKVETDDFMAGELEAVLESISDLYQGLGKEKAVGGENTIEGVLSAVILTLYRVEEWSSAEKLDEDDAESLKCIKRICDRLLEEYSN